VSEIGESFDQVQMEKVFVASQQGLSRQENAYMLGDNLHDTVPVPVR
jgi:hypothetical protein